ncbi:MAG: transposase [Acidobacteriota bacterium]|nr:transposase [Acidobacteriota bacterium]
MGKASLFKVSQLVYFNVTAQWVGQQMVEALPWDTAPKYLLRDRDATYGEGFRRRVQSLLIKEVITAPRSPWQNAYVERIIGSIRRDCLDHIIVFDERHLNRILKNSLGVDRPLSVESTS